MSVDTPITITGRRLLMIPVVLLVLVVAWRTFEGVVTTISTRQAVQVDKVRAEERQRYESRLSSLETAVSDAQGRIERLEHPPAPQVP